MITIRVYILENSEKAKVEHTEDRNINTGKYLETSCSVEKKGKTEISAFEKYDELRWLVHLKVQIVSGNDKKKLSCRNRAEGDNWEKRNWRKKRIGLDKLHLVMTEFYWKFPVIHFTPTFWSHITHENKSYCLHVCIIQRKSALVYQLY